MSPISFVVASDVDDVAMELIKFKSDTVGSSVIVDDTVGISVGTFAGESDDNVGSPVGDSDTDNVGMLEGLSECM